MIRKKNIVSMPTVAAALILVATLAGSANSAIVVDVANAATFSTGFAGAPTYTFTNAQLGGFDATVYDKLVFVASSEGMVDVIKVTYGGVDLLEAVTAESSNRVAAIWFLDNPTVNGDLFIDGQNNGNGVGGAIFGLTGTATGVGLAGTDGSGSSDATNEVTINASLDSIVIGSALGNNNVPGVGSPQTTIKSGIDSGSSFNSSGYQIVNPAGNVTASFTTSRVVAAAEFFAVIPEPASLALLGLGGLLIAGRPRRR